MTKIKLIVNGNKLDISESSYIASGGVNTVECQFSFDSSWHELEKTAVFFQDSSVVKYVMLDESGKCIVPHEILSKKGMMYIGVTGVLAQSEEILRRQTTNLARKWIDEGSYLASQESHIATADAYEQIITSLSQKIDKQEGKSLSEENFTLQDKEKLYNLNIASLPDSRQYNSLSITSLEWDYGLGEIYCDKLEFEGDYRLVPVNFSMSMWHNGTPRYFFGSGFVDDSGLCATGIRISEESVTSFYSGSSRSLFYISSEMSSFCFNITKVYNALSNKTTFKISAFSSEIENPINQWNMPMMDFHIYAYPALGTFI